MKRITYELVALSPSLLLLADTVHHHGSICKPVVIATLQTVINGYTQVEPELHALLKLESFAQLWNEQMMEPKKLKDILTILEDLTGVTKLVSDQSVQEFGIPLITKDRSANRSWDFKQRN